MLLAQASLVTKTKFDDKLSNLNRKITKIKTHHLLVQNELKKLQTFDSSYFIGKNYFENNGTQNYLVFQPLNKYFKLINNTLSILSRQSKENYLLKLLTLLLRVFLRQLIMLVTNESEIYWKLFKTVK